MSVPDFLQPTYLMLKHAFSDGVSEESYWIILRLLYDDMADENLAIVMSVFSGKSWEEVVNDIYRVCHMKFAPRLLEEVKTKLDASGFEEWKKKEC